MDKTREYYKLYFTTLKETVKKSIGWREAIIAFLSLAIGGLGSFLYKGRDFLIEQTFTAIVYTLLPIGLIALYYLVRFAITAHVIIYSDLNIELEKATWKGIDISEYEFLEQSGFGVGINIHNGKLIPIRDLKVGIYEIRKGRTIISQQTRDLPWYMNVSDMWQRVFTVIPLFNIGEDGKVLVANWDNHSAYFETFQDNNEPKINLDIGEKYYGKIVIVGRLQELYVSYPVYVCELQYDGEKVDLKLFGERLIYDENESPKLFNQ